jgi:indole-3-glycerol phosphate synthase
MGLTDLQSHIPEAKRSRLIHQQTSPLEELREKALEERGSASPHLLRDVLARPDTLNVIAEIKRACPWQDVIRADFDPAALALAYSRSGAAAISVWTEEDYLGGSLNDLQITRAAVSLPLLRKDFIIESSQVYETAIVGADALLLIAAALDEERLAFLLRITEEELGLDALVEVQNANEMLWAHAMGATLIGIDNRNPSTFEISLDVSVEVARAAPKNVLLVSENGLRTRKQLRGLHALGYKGFIVEEPLMAGDHPDES